MKNGRLESAPDTLLMNRSAHPTVSGEIVQAAEENIRQPERELRLAVDALPGLVWSALADGSIDPAIVRR